ncbi:Coiled-coil domain containing, partial [Perkinsus olseni]
MTSQPASDDIFPGLDVDPALPDPANPFLIPPDDEIFLMRDHERRVRQREREKTKRMKVWQKTTASSRMGRVEKPIMSELARANSIRRRIEATRADSEPPRRERENVSDFLSKKRDMFLVQMSLDVKRNEIRKLEEKAKMKGEALEKSKQVLEEDIARLDKFLQANDALAHKAMKTADNLSKKKQERTVKLKQLKAQLLVIQSEITKLQEQMEDCLKYKTFLEKLTPAEWTAQQEEVKRLRKRQRRKATVRDIAIAEALEAMLAEISVVIDSGLHPEAPRRRGSRRNDLTEEDIIAMKEKEME